MGRNIREVIVKVLEVTPPGEEVFRSELEDIRESALYKAPERMVDCWEAGGKVFYNRFGKTLPTSGWGKQAVDIWLGRSP